MRTVDVLVVGAGLAGLHTARLLAARGLDVLVVDKRRSLTSGVRTTGIFVRRTLDDFDLPAHLLGPGVRDVVLYPPSRRHPIRLTSDRDEYRVADMPGVYAHARERAAAAGASVLLGVRYDGGAGDVVDLHGYGALRARFVVGADGARSRVARDLGLDVNRRLLVGAEVVYPVRGSGGPPTFHCVLDPRIAPGYLGWVIEDGRHAHVGVAGYANHMRRGVRHLLDEFAASAPGVGEPAGEVERRGGPIPVGGVLQRLACPRGLLVGDAAGAVSPLTAGGLDPCLRLSELAAAVTTAYVRSGDVSVLRQYDGAMLRSRFRGRLLLRRAFGGLRSPRAVEAAVAALRGPGGRALASRVLFGDGSFPDVGDHDGRPVPRTYVTPRAAGKAGCGP
ncbi:NAD(P)/FAD-dependent oxidoreductase [Dactylosporangium vinaceum]|uniref:FAD-dependent oxidoreductase n=1 Tax=Dactylosporangium vinaceum TaxID=53362 RepID=A0ABV5MRU8_9ACTN|nr:NAD(P)/FAD-dependent oxidoreductase [Dactylosporangium vinaceum]UAC00342.1 NAD(P)/FAD-dependent oxidoreductase [Dactylosporangium vinaceum]